VFVVRLSLSLSWSHVHTMWVIRWSSLVLMLMPAATHVNKCPEMCVCQRPTQQQLIVNCGTCKNYYECISTQPDPMTSDFKPTRCKMKESVLAEELDKLLSDKNLTQNLTSLRISGTSLTQVPMSVCQLTNLTSLNLDNNQLTRLPDNCFIGMIALQSLSASCNDITQIQDGLFEGLNNLTELHFDDNQINDIGLRVFSNKSDLVSLRTITLISNKLRSLEPWPLIRGLHGRSSNGDVFVDLTDNLISTFTNMIRWQFNYSMLNYARLMLWENNVSHMNDIAVGWGDKMSSFCSRWPLTVTSDDKMNNPLFEVDISFSENYACDCQDFCWHAIQRKQNYTNYYNFGVTEKDLICNAPPRLANRAVHLVPLTEFECELSDRCPSNCQCVYRPANATLHVYCSAANLSSLPLSLPPLPKSYVRYKLDFSNNRLLRRLEGRPYFVNTSVLDVSSSAIDVVDIKVWLEIARMQSPFVTPHVDLHNNMIKSLPSEVTAIINTNSLRLTLHQNPWECFCEDRWIIDWFKSMSGTSSNVNAVCSSPPRLYGATIAKSTGDDFCVDPSVRMLKIALSTTLAPAAALLIVGFAMHRLRFRLYRRWKFHPFDRDECVGEDMDYDVFLSCSSADDGPHGLRILGAIESKGYRVCYHERDFLPGQRITDGMVHGTERSKRTVCLVSDNFIKR